jgi:hypothetical protein
MGAHAVTTLDRKLVEVDEVLLPARRADDVLKVAHTFPG